MAVTTTPVEEYCLTNVVLSHPPEATTRPLTLILSDSVCQTGVMRSLLRICTPMFPSRICKTELMGYTIKGEGNET